jgi:hypothetical protein
MQHVCRRTFLLVACTRLAACGGSASSPDASVDSAPSPNQVNGDLGSMPLAVMDGIFVEAEASGFKFVGTTSFIMLASFGDACGKQATSTGVPFGRMLFLDLGITDSRSAATPAHETGDYVVMSGFPFPPSSKLAEVFYEADGANCRKQVNEEASSGAVTVSRTDAATLAGTFDITFPTVGHVTGTFSTAQCGALNPNRTPLNGCP